jgi:hypothetical protein
MGALQQERIEAAAASSLRAWFARDPELRARYRRFRRTAFGIVGTNYDISRTCNLTCEGCLFFEGSDYLAHLDDKDDAQWDAFFASEAARGVNFAYLAGAEPALRPERLRIAARHIKRGVIFTNGTIAIDPSLPYALHVSLWGNVEDTVRLRGGSSYEKAFRLYGKDPRATFIYTVNAQNLGGVWGAAERCAQSGARLSFSIFSPTEQYRDKLAAGVTADGDYFRISSAEAHLAPDDAMLAAIRTRLDEVAAAFPGTVIYAPAYNEWVTNPGGLYQIDPATGWALDCETRRAPYFRHVRTDLTTSESKCCSPNIDCRDCRAYSMAAGTAVSRFRRFAATYQGFRDWMDIAEQWCALFLRASPEMISTVPAELSAPA